MLIRRHASPIVLLTASAVAGATASPGVVLGHSTSISLGSGLTTLSLDPLIWPMAIFAGLGYLAAAARVNANHPLTPVPRWRMLAWLAGILTVVVALQTAIDFYADDLLSVHMVQHLLLTLVAPPLLALGAPGTLLLRAADTYTRQNVLLPLLHSRLTRLLTHPLLAWTAFAGVMLATHFTPLYDAALDNPGLHYVEHGLYLASGILFWWPVVGADPMPYRLRHGWRMAYLLAMMPVGAAVGLAIYFAGEPLYAHYAALPRSWQPSALVDQQLGGLLMWAAADVLLLGAVALVVADWMRADERRSRILDARRAAGMRQLG